MKKLLSCIAALFTIFTIVSCLQEERSPEEILVPSPAKVECSDASLVLASKVPSGSEKLVDACGFLVGTTKDLADAVTVEGTLNANTFAADLPSRKYGTTYYICSYVTNGHGSEIRSAISSYNLKPLKEYIEFEPVELLSYSKAARKADVAFSADIWNGVSVSQTGVCFGVTTSPSDDGRYQEGTLSEEGVVTVTLSNFDVDTQYYLRAYVKDGEYTAYGEVIPLIIKLTPPTLSSVIVSSVESNSALFSSSVTSNGGDPVSEVGFYYSTEETVDPETSRKINQPYSEASFDLQANELAANTKYYVKAYAVNSAGVGYSQTSDFTTSAGAPSVTTLGATDVTSTGATLSGTVIADNGASITERGFVWMQGTGTPTTDSFKLKVDGTTGEFTSTLTGLEPNQKFSFRAYAINSKGTSYGDVMTFTTVAGLPTLSAMKVSDITTTSATFTCAVTGHGGDIVSEVGFYIGKEETVDVEAALKISESYTSDSFTLTATDLEVGTDYYVMAFAKNSVGESYSVIVSFKTVSTAPSVTTVGSSAITASSVLLSGEVTDDNGEDITERGFVWLKGTGTPTTSDYKIQSEGTTGEFTAAITDIVPNHTYSFRAYAINAKGTSYGETMNFMIEMSLPTVTTVGVTDITDNSAVSGGVIVDDGGGDIIAKGVVWSRSENPMVEDSFRTEDGTGSGSYISYLTDLTPGRTYYVRAYATNLVGTSYGEELQFTVAGELQAVHLQAANCFIISSPIVYSFKTVKGNSSESVGIVSSAEVLWESYGTYETPVVGSLVSSVSVEGDLIVFDVPEPYHEGNAVIAAKGADGTILWSWHIWLTDEPQGHVYNNNAGTMMDRNLGATSATPSDVGALGLLYQWGRKDPFLGSASIGRAVDAQSTITWPSAVSSDSSTGTVDYVTSHPTTFVTGGSSSSNDWHYSSRDNTLWQSEKTIYDPCPVGWRVPDGGDEGVWSTAKGSSSSYYRMYDINMGMNFSGDFGIASTIWYPASGFRYYDDGALFSVGDSGSYWSVTPGSNRAYELYFDINGDVCPTLNSSPRAYGFSVRCLQEGTGGGPQYDNNFSTSGAENLSDAGTANSYIVSNVGTYSISPVKGNSSESIGSVASAEVLWETFGTDERIFKGNLISGALYENGQIYFKTADSYREGNAVIAAKDAAGTILWSWHIWLTDQPLEQIYNNDAGTMMDRNLGATSATPGDVGALGLLYQWGRKDPFLGSSSISTNTEAKSTITWPSAVSSDSSTGTVDYVTSHPMTFVKGVSPSSYDWHYSSRDNTLWQSEKTIYDPCPSGWRVPDGGSSGVWYTAGFADTSYDSTNEGMNFSGDFGSASTTWYPASGDRSSIGGALLNVGDGGNYWSVTPVSSSAYSLDFIYNGNVNPTYYYDGRANGFSVRCFKEGTGGDTKYDNDFSTSGARNLSDEGTANSYIVSSAGTYSISPVKGNSSEPVGSVASAEVLWETFGTDDRVFKGNLISGARYENGRIYFKTADAYREGNAVVAAKDAAGTILWSWHIWLTDQPQGQIYNNNAGTMMDRNLGATSATPGDVGALGLLYQWGRKDPFLGSSSISDSKEAKSTITWPSAVSSYTSTGTVDYVTSNPTTFVQSGSSPYDWHYSSRDNTLWQSEKTIYDPCPVGWRVPDGGSNGVWQTAGFASTSYDSSNEGINFSISSPSATWYPASGFRDTYGGALSYVGSVGYYWSVTPERYYAYGLNFNYNGNVYPTDFIVRAYGYSVRCLQELE